MAEVMLGGHLPTIFAALFDVLVLKRSSLAQLSLPLSTLCVVGTLYSVLYILLTLANYTINGGYFPYPFMEKLSSPVHWAVFWAIVAAFVNLCITFFWTLTGLNAKWGL